MPWLLAVAFLLASPAHADVPERPDAPPQAASASSASSGETLRYRVTIDAPDALRATLGQSVDLIRWQTYEEMTESLFDALTQKAIAQAKEAAATEGFFSAHVAVDIDRAARPLAVTVRVTPGPQARVATARLEVTGAAATDDEGRDAIARVRAREWPSRPGAPFRQSVWTAREIGRDVATLAGSAFAAARSTAERGERRPRREHRRRRRRDRQRPPLSHRRDRRAGADALHGGMVRNYSTQSRVIAIPIAGSTSSCGA